ncbi:MAG TPA: glycosyltransferase [Gemmatimonadaceae bacterium]|nr:glycosyltransferase [Gemmatimonadaceae bacterium]
MSATAPRPSVVDAPAQPRRRALLLAYYYPPCGGVPVMRWLRFTRNLPSRGWLCDVVTQRDGSDDYFRPDPTLLSQIPPEATLIRIEDPAQRVVAFLNAHTKVRWGPWLDRVVKVVPVPDDKLGWGLRVKRYVRAHRERLGGYAVLIATGYPWSTLVVAPFVKRMLGLPLLVDLRDPWSQHPGIRVADWLHRRMERRVFQAADLVCVISEGMREMYASLYPDVADRIRVVYNGIDYSVTPRGEPRPQSRGDEARSARRLRIVYAGSLLDKPEPKPYQRTLVPFLETLVELRRRHPDLAARCEVEVLSNPVPKTRALAMRLGVADLIRFSDGRVPFETVQQAQRNADVLLLVSTSDPDYDRMVMTGKIFEYIAAARPILALCTAESDVGQTVKRFALGRVESSPTAGADALAALLEPGAAWCAAFADGVRAAQDHFDVQRQLDRMVEMLDELAATGRATPPSRSSAPHAARR